VGSTVTVDVNGVYVRSGPSISDAVVGSQNTNTQGAVTDGCVQDSASLRVFCNIKFESKPDGCVPAEHLVVQPAQPGSNPIDDAQTFVRQQYYDFLNRAPDQQGLDYWTGEIVQCGPDAKCVHDRRVGAADAFFFEPEFQVTGAYVYRLYKAAFGTRPTFAEFATDRSQVVVGPGLDQSKTTLAQSLAQRFEFVQTYPRTLTAQQFCDALLNAINQNSGVDLSSQRDTLMSLYDGTDAGRAAILRFVADNQAFTDGEYNSSFVTMGYFGYLKRDIDEGGFLFWLGQVSRFPLRNVAIQQAMTCSFITSAEYQLRFGSTITHSNSECPQ